MQYKQTISVPSGTPKAEPEVRRVQLTQGTLDRLVVDIPAGHEGLAGMSLWRAGTQLYPFTPNEWFKGNDTNIRIDDNLEMDQPPFYLTFKGYNEDSKYDHGFHIMVRVNRPGKDPVMDIREDLKTLADKSNYPSEDWLSEVVNDLSAVSTNIETSLLPKLDQLENVLEDIREGKEEKPTVEELSKF